jgi:hypothetical protein
VRYSARERIWGGDGDMLNGEVVKRLPWGAHTADGGLERMAMEDTKLGLNAACFSRRCSVLTVQP